MFDFREFLNSAIGNIQNSPTLFAIFANPFYIALIITLIVLIIFSVVIYESPRSLGGSLVKSGFWVFFSTTGVLILYSALLNRRSAASAVTGAFDYDDDDFIDRGVKDDVVDNNFVNHNYADRDRGDRPHFPATGAHAVAPSTPLSAIVPQAASVETPPPADDSKLLFFHTASTQ